MAEPFLASQLVQEFCFDLNEKEPLIRIIKKNCTTWTFWQLDKEIKINKRTGRKGGSRYLLIKAALCCFSNSKWWFQSHFYHSLTCDGEEGTPAVAMAHSAGLKSRYIYIYNGGRLPVTVLPEQACHLLQSLWRLCHSEHTEPSGLASQERGVDAGLWSVAVKRGGGQATNVT